MEIFVDFYRRAAQQLMLDNSTKLVINASILYTRVVDRPSIVTTYKCSNCEAVFSQHIKETWPNFSISFRFLLEHELFRHW